MNFKYLFFSETIFKFGYRLKYKFIYFKFYYHYIFMKIIFTDEKLINFLSDMKIDDDLKLQF